MVDRELSLWRSWRLRSDGEAFGSLVRPHVEFAERLARRSGLAAADADDVVQRSLIRLSAEPSDRPARVGLRAWLGRSVLNEARMLFRARRRREGLESRAPARASPESNPVEVHDEVDRALSDLDDGARRIVELRYFHDLEYREIAFIEGGTALGARLRVHRALKRLRGRLGRGAALSIAALATTHVGTASADVAMARCLDVVRSGRAAGLASGGASSIEGGLIVGTGAKIGITGLAAALVATAFIVMGRGRSGDAPGADATLVASTMSSPAAPPVLAAPRPPQPPALQSAPIAAPADSVSPPAVPLDAPIPAGKGSVAGVLKFKDGEPLAHARVALWGTPQVRAETDDDGRFHIHGDWVGNRDLTLIGADGAVLGLAPVEMKLDSRVTITVSLERGVTLSGTVREAVTLAPVAGAKIKLRRPGAHSDNSMQGGFGFATSDASGHFRFEHVPSASYALEAAAPGHEAHGIEFVVGGGDQVLDVRLKVARALTVRLSDVPASAIGSTIQWMIQSNGDAPASSRISLRGKSVLIAPGELRLDAPPPGEYELTLFAGKILPRLEASVHVTEAAAPEVSIAVPAGAGVEGTLLGRDGKPIFDTPIRVGESAVARTDSLGRFRIEQAAAGRQPVWVGGGLGSLSVRVGSVDVAPSGTTALVVNVPGSASISFTLASPGVRGLATLSSDDGTRIADVWPDGTRRAEIPYLASGGYRLDVHGHDSVALERRFQLVDGQPFDLGEITLDALPVVPVHVTFPPGVERPAHVTVFAGSGSPGTFGRIEFDGEGRGWLKGLPAGEYHLMFQWTQTANTVDLPTADLVVKDGITTPIEIVLRAK